MDITSALCMLIFEVTQERDPALLQEYVSWRQAIEFLTWRQEL